MFWVPVEARWDTIQAKAKLPSIGQDIDHAMDLIEKENPSVRGGVLPRNYGREGGLDKGRLGQLVDLIGSIGFTESDDHGSDDVLGRVYEYFLGQFAGKETGKDAGAFYTPRSVVKTLIEMLEPTRAASTTPACGSGGMFVQSAEFVKAHGGKRNDISVFGQEYTDTTWKLAKMNLALRGGIEPTSAIVRPTPFLATFTLTSGQTSSSPTRPSTSVTGGMPSWPTIRGGSTARRRKAMPTSHGCNISSTTFGRTARLVSFSRMARSARSRTAKARFARSSSMQTWSIAS